MNIRHCLLALAFLHMSSVTQAAEEFTVAVAGQELTVQHYPAKGEDLVIWIAPGFGSHQRVFDTALKLAVSGVEVWHVDLGESLFLTGGVTTMRGFDGHYVAGLIDAAYAKTGKRVTLLSRSYGSLPVLKGARQWQLQHAHDKAAYLNGAILFSPEMLSHVPALGLKPEYDPIAGASNIPIMIYQGGKRGSRWQLPNMLEKLYAGNGQVFVTIMPGVSGLFYENDTAPATLTLLEDIPKKIPTALRFLGMFTVPKQALPLNASERPASRGLDISLKPFKANPQPHVLDLFTADGIRIMRTDYRGKVTVVNFWASWCPPCVEEIPSLNNLRKKMQGKPFELISVNYAEDKTVVEQFLQRVNVDFPVLLDTDGQVSGQWGVIAYPSTFVIGPDGSIRYGVNAAIHWDTPEVVGALNALLEKSSP